MNATKLITLSLLGVSILFGSYGFAEEEAPKNHIEKIKANEVLRVAVKNNIPGFAYKDPNTDEYKGYEIALATRIAKEIGDNIEVEFTDITTANRNSILDSDYVDCIVSSYSVTEDRKKLYNLSHPYFKDTVTVLVNNKDNIESLKDLEGAKVGVIAQSNSAKSLVKALVDYGYVKADDFDAANFDESQWNNFVSFRIYETYESISDDLSEGKITAFCTDKILLKSFLTPDRHFIKEDFSLQSYAIVTPKNSNLGEFIDKLIVKWSDDGTLDKLLKENTK